MRGGFDRRASEREKLNLFQGENEDEGRAETERLENEADNTVEADVKETDPKRQEILKHLGERLEAGIQGDGELGADELDMSDDGPKAELTWGGEEETTIPDWLVKSDKAQAEAMEMLGPLKSSEQERTQLLKEQATASISKVLTKWQKQDEPASIRKLQEVAQEEYSSRGELRGNRVGPPRPPKRKDRGGSVAKHFVTAEDYGEIAQLTSANGIDPNYEMVRALGAMVEVLQDDPALSGFFDDVKRFGDKIVFKYLEDSDFLRMVHSKFMEIARKKGVVGEDGTLEPEGKSDDDGDEFLLDNSRNQSRQVNVKSPHRQPGLVHNGAQKGERGGTKQPNKQNTIESDESDEQKALLLKELEEAVADQEFLKAHEIKQKLKNMSTTRRLTKLKKMMKEAVEQEDFLRAQEIKIQIESLNGSGRHQQSLPSASPISSRTPHPLSEGSQPRQKEQNLPSSAPTLPPNPFNDLQKDPEKQPPPPPPPPPRAPRGQSYFDSSRLRRGDPPSAPPMIPGGGVGSGVPGFPMGKNFFGEYDPNILPDNVAPPGWIPPPQRAIEAPHLPSTPIQTPPSLPPPPSPVNVPPSGAGVAAGLKLDPLTQAFRSAARFKANRHGTKEERDAWLAKQIRGISSKRARSTQ